MLGLVACVTGAFSVKDLTSNPNPENEDIANIGCGHRHNVDLEHIDIGV